MLDVKTIGARVRACRENVGLTREKLAEMIDVSPRFIYDIELGNRGMSLSTLANLAPHLHVSTDYLLYGTLPFDGAELPVELHSLISICPKEQLERLTAMVRLFVGAVQDDEN